MTGCYPKSQQFTKVLDYYSIDFRRDSEYILRHNVKTRRRKHNTMYFPMHGKCRGKCNNRQRNQTCQAFFNDHSGWNSFTYGFVRHLGSHVVLNSTADPAHPCILEIDRQEHPIQKNVKAAILKDKVIVWGVRSKYEVKGRRRMDYTVIIVDPKQCSYKPVKTYEEEFLPGGFVANKNLPEVVTHDDSFDVIYSTVRSCTPCRYSLDGKILDVKHTIEPERLEPTISTHVKAFNSPDLKNGYFYAHNYDNKDSVLKLYDHDFNVVKEKKFKHRSDAVAVSSDGHPAITSCYYESMRSYPPKDQKVNCERFDGKLESVFSTDLPLLEKHDPASVSLAIDDSGNSFVAVVESNLFGEDDKYRLYKVDSTGKVTNVINLGGTKRQGFFGSYHLRGFIFNKQYCFEITKSTIWNPTEADENETIKCIAI